jgi:hypothetical protein
MQLPANMKARTIFYSILGRLVFSDAHIDLLESFLQPFARVFEVMNAQVRQHCLVIVSLLECSSVCVFIPV